MLISESALSRQFAPYRAPNPIRRAVGCPAMTPKDVDDHYLRLIANTAHQAIVRGYSLQEIAELDQQIRAAWDADRHAARVRGLADLAATFRSMGYENLAALVESFEEHDEPI